MSFVLNKTTLLASLALASTVTATVPAWGNCQNDHACVDGFYCQPWNANTYQCIQTFPQCPQQFTDVDMPGNDLKEAQVSQPGDCCKACTETPGCTHYTYWNDRNGTPGCYLKTNGPGTQVSKPGLVSGIVRSSTTTPTATPTPTPSTSKGTYLQVNGVDFTKQDISDVGNIANINDCKSLCDQTKGCKAVSYAHNHCYFKSGAINYSINKDVNALVQVPAGVQCFANSDFLGHDIGNIQTSFESCQSTCLSRSGCNAAVWVQSASEYGTCYMKSLAAGQQPIPNNRAAIACTNTNKVPITPTPSSSTPSSPTPMPTSSQCTAGWNDCTATKCCSTKGLYCQPWTSGYSGCIQIPSQCPTQLTDTDLVGNDLKEVPASQPGDCCKACAETAGCKAYTYWNNRNGTPGCYLKSSATGPRANTAGLVSGIL